jgi:hypothetical protein
MLAKYRNDQMELGGDPYFSRQKMKWQLSGTWATGWKNQHYLVH